MKVFLDFDDVLFDTRAYYEGLKNLFNEYGVKRELFEKAYLEIREESLVDGAWCYSFENHIARLRRYVSFDENGLRKKLAAYITDTSQFLFPDVRAFLTVLQKSGARAYILSFGDVEHQTAKITGTGIARYIEKNIITNKEKGVALQGEGIGAGHGSWFFDDRIKYIESVKQSFPKIQTVFVNRKEGRFHDEPNEFCDYVVSNLKEAERPLLNFKS
jgi:hypothetical protein